MSWLDKYQSDWIKAAGNLGSGIMNGVSDLSKFMGGPSAQVLSKASGNAANFLQNEIANKSDLRAAQSLGFLSGFPIVGGIVNGIQGTNMLEDLFNRTGKTAAYGGLQNVGSGGIGSAAAQALRIADGNNDLYRYYAGEPDQWSINIYG